MAYPVKKIGESEQDRGQTKLPRLELPQVLNSSLTAAAQTGLQSSP